MAIVDDADLWQKRYEELNKLGAARENEVNTLRATQPDAAFWKHHDAFTQTVMAYLHVTQTYLAGFSAIHRGADGVTESQLLRNWVKNVDIHRSGHTMASMSASAHCSTLEGFLRSLIPEWVDQRVVDHVRARYSRKSRSGKAEELSKKVDSAWKQLDAWLKPSGGGAFADWLKLVSLVFQCRFAPPTESVLEDMITFRHEITHPSGLLTDGRIDSPGPNRTTCWTLAVLAMQYTITLSIVRAKASK